MKMALPLSVGLVWFGLLQAGDVVDLFQPAGEEGPLGGDFKDGDPEWSLLILIGNRGGCFCCCCCCFCCCCSAV